MSTNKNLQWGVIFSYITMAAGILVSLTYTPFMLRMLGQQQYGLYNMGQSAVSYLGMAEFGFGSAVIRYISKYRAEGNEKKLSGLYGLFFLLYSGLAVLVLAVGTVICVFSDRFFVVTTGAEGYRELRTIILIMVVNLTVTFATTPYSAIITAYEKFTFLKVTNLIYTLLKPLVMIPLLIWGYKAVTLSVVTIVLTVLLNGANILYVKRVLKISVSMDRRNMDFGLLKEIAGYSFFIFLGTVTGQLNDNTDNIILGAIFGEAAVAVYSIGFQLNSYVQQIPGVISSVFFPRVTARITKGASMEEMSALMTRVGRLQFYVVFLLCSGFCLFGQEFIGLWAGEGYETAYWIVLALILPAAIPNIQSLPVQVLQAMNRHQFKAIVYVICAVVNVLLSIPAGLAYGPIGCAVCTGIATLLTKGFVINWYYSIKIHLDIKGFWKSILGLLTRFLPLCLVGVVLNLVINEQGWFWMFAKILAYTACFALYSLAFCLNPDEKQLLAGVLKKTGIKK